MSVSLLTTAQQNEISTYINIYRTKNQAPPMIWDNNIATFSQTWASHLDSSNFFVHSNNPMYGENLAFFQGYGVDTMKLLKMAIDNWYNEIAYYNFNAPGFSEKTGHFTCLVWLSSITFGMGITINPSTSATVVVFNTAPPGNVIGQFQQNVLPVNGAIPIPSLPPVTPINAPNAPPTGKQQIIITLNNLIHQLKTFQKMIT
jgi:hypothetical protein